MNRPKEPVDFVKALLAQEPVLGAAAFGERRVQLLDRLAAAERKERRGRRISLGAGIVALVGVSLIFAGVANQVKKEVPWPDWALTLAAMAVILMPATTIVLTTVYFFRHRRELKRTRDDAYHAALESLPQQIAELRQQLEDLRRQLPPAPPDKTRQEGAFTLPEMLTVVAILALLAGLLFPALAGAKGKSRSIVCGNHLSQMGKALAMYEGDSGCYPGAGQTALASNMMIKPSEDSWTAKITPYLLGSTGVFSCPSYTPFKFGGLFANAYGYNANGCAVIGTMEANLGLGYGAIDKKHPLVRVGEVVNPADMIAIGDLQLPPGVWINVVSPNLQRAMGGLSSLVPSRHNGGANMTFCDGHVENARQSRWTEAADRARRQWNRDHEPHREAW